MLFVTSLIRDSEALINQLESELTITLKNYP